jgi:hypothetical protein
VSRPADPEKLLRLPFNLASVLGCKQPPSPRRLAACSIVMMQTHGGRLEPCCNPTWRAHKSTCREIPRARGHGEATEGGSAPSPIHRKERAPALSRLHPGRGQVVLCLLAGREGEGLR